MHRMTWPDVGTRNRSTRLALAALAALVLAWLPSSPARAQSGDADGDGVDDASDLCPFTDGAVVDIRGCDGFQHVGRVCPITGSLAVKCWPTVDDYEDCVDSAADYAQRAGLLDLGDVIAVKAEAAALAEDLRAWPINQDLDGVEKIALCHRLPTFEPRLAASRACGEGPRGTWTAWSAAIYAVRKDGVKLGEEVVVEGDIVSGSKFESKKNTTVNGAVYAAGQVKIDENAVVRDGRYGTGEKKGKGAATLVDMGPVPDDLPIFPTLDTAWYDDLIAQAAALPKGDLKDNNLHLDGDTILVNGKVEIEKPGLTGPGMIVATGDIVIKDEASVGADIKLISGKKLKLGKKVLVGENALLYGAKRAETGDECVVASGAALLSPKDVAVGKKTSFDGIVYGGKKAKVQDEAVVTGAVIARDKVEVKNKADVVHDCAAMPASLPPGLTIFKEHMASSAYVCAVDEAGWTAWDMGVYAGAIGGVKAGDRARVGGDVASLGKSEFAKLNRHDGALFSAGDVKLGEDHLMSGSVWANGAIDAHATAQYTFGGAVPMDRPPFPTLDTSWYDGLLGTALASGGPAVDTMRYELNGATVYVKGKFKIKDGGELSGPGTVVSSDEIFIGKDASVGGDVTLIAVKSITVDERTDVSAGALLFTRDKIELRNDVVFGDGAAVALGDLFIKQRLDVQGVFYAAGQVVVEPWSSVDGQLFGWEKVEVKNDADVGHACNEFPTVIPPGLEAAEWDGEVPPPPGDGPDIDPTDTDQDGVYDVLDACPGTLPGKAVNSDGCSGSQLVQSMCPGSINLDTGVCWDRHSDFVACVAAACLEARGQGLMSYLEAIWTVIEAALSDVGVGGWCDDVACVDGQLRLCDEGCGLGLQACWKGHWGACSSSPELERCDGVDNDCDGAIDEGNPIALCAQEPECEFATCVCVQGAGGDAPRCVLE